MRLAAPSPRHPRPPRRGPRARPASRSRFQLAACLVRRPPHPPRLARLLQLPRLRRRHSVAQIGIRPRQTGLEPPRPPWPRSHRLRGFLHGQYRRQTRLLSHGLLSRPLHRAPRRQLRRPPCRIGRGYLALDMLVLLGGYIVADRLGGGALTLRLAVVRQSKINGERKRARVRGEALKQSLCFANMRPGQNRRNGVETRSRLDGFEFERRLFGRGLLPRLAVPPNAKPREVSRHPPRSDALAVFISTED